MKCVVLVFCGQGAVVDELDGWIFSDLLSGEGRYLSGWGAVLGEEVLGVWGLAVAGQAG